jgi:hypothetical protein
MADHTDWLSLVEADGLVISEPVLEEHFPDGPSPVPQGVHNWFRRSAERYRVTQSQPDPTKRNGGARQWIDFLLETVLELPAGAWKKADEIPANLRVVLAEFEQELCPERVLMHEGKPVLAVTITDTDQKLNNRDRREGRWKASPTTKLERLLRETGVPLGLVTNGEDLRLVYAPPGLNGGSITWTSRLLTEEKATLDAFYSLLGRDLLLPKDPDAHTLADLCRISQDRQGEVADRLGVQVRNGLERLLWAWGAADRATKGELLQGMTEDQVYEMGLVVMMRFVFLLYAEERDLLPHGEVLYDQGYGVTYLWHRLLDQKHDDEARLDDTFDAWDRFLSTCRLVHDGCDHPDLSLLAYGGRLFDPKRFPVLENPACKVRNRTMFTVLHSLLFAQQRKGGEPQRVGYWALDIEQIGYIYEGLLDHRAARAGGVPLVKLKGGGERAFKVDELVGLGVDKLVELVVEVTGKKADSVREALATEPEAKDLAELDKFPDAVVKRVRPLAPIIQCDEVVPPGWWYLTTGTSRRASGAHYTPQQLTERIVRVTLEPLVYRNVEGKPGLLVEPKQVRSPREILSLKVCDIAMGSGAFLVQAVRYLGDRLVAAWDRALAAAHEKDAAAVLSMPYAAAMTDAEGERPINPEHRDEMVMWARRYVVERCIYGVDVNPLAVEMAKLSLWLTTLAKDRPFTFLDHALRCGDSLVGVDEEQLRRWSLSREKGQEIRLDAALVQKAVDEAVSLREQLEAITVVDVTDADRKEKLLEAADKAMGRVRLAGDLLIAPSFAGGKARDQQDLRDTLLAQFSKAKTQDDRLTLRAEVDRLLDGQRTFHWQFEFPEVFRREGRAGFDAIVGNPPFLGGRRMRGVLGDNYVEALVDFFPGSSLNADLCAFFYLRAFASLTAGGCFGLLATNTIGQGDSKETGLDRIVREGGVIYSAIPRMPWPGLAAVNVSVVHIAATRWHGSRQLDDVAVDVISPALDAVGLVGAPETLAENDGKSFQGSVVVGLGFVLEPGEAEALIKKDRRNAEVLFPYLNGEDLNSRPDQSPSRWIINFFDWPLEKAERYPDCMAVVREKVYPERMKVNRETHKKFWWHYGDKRPALYRTISERTRVLVRPEVSRTWAFAFVPKGWVYSHMLIVFPTSDGVLFPSVQSTLHRVWADQHTSSMKTDMRYAPSDCFDTYPFPQGLTPRQTEALEASGGRYDEHRRQLMLQNSEGLTKTYNRFHDPEENDPGIVELRRLHVEMDTAVRDAYGWTDLDLEHDWIKKVTTEEKKDKKTGKVKTVEKIEHRYTIPEKARQEVLKRLLALNHKIHAEEVAAGLHDKKKGKKAKAEGESDVPTEPAGTKAAASDRSARARPVTMDLFGPKT